MLSCKEHKLWCLFNAFRMLPVLYEEKQTDTHYVVSSMEHMCQIIALSNIRTCN